MNKKVFKATLAILFFALVLCGCSSKEEPSKNGNEGNLNNSSNTAVEVQAGNSSITEKDDNTLTTKGSDNDVTIGTETVEPEQKSSDPNKAMVVFKDEEGNVLKSEEIERGDDATPPDNPEKDGYRFVGWNYDYEDIQTDITVVPVFEEITEPTLVVKNGKAKAGDKIEVPVSVQNNPGLLGVVVNIQYDESVLTLTDVSTGSLMSEYVFTPPKNLKSDCNAAWNINDMPENSEDGEMMVLHFKVSNKAEPGEYPISVSCLNNAFDDSYSTFSLDSISGSVSVQ